MGKYVVIGTWAMAYEGIQAAAKILQEGGSCADACLDGVSLIEDNPNFHSVGYGGRPDADGRVTLDGGFMDGDTLHFGAVACIEGFRSPARIAYSLRNGDYNNFLVGKGAEEYALAHGFERRNNLTVAGLQIYEDEVDRRTHKAYDGHDTICFAALDQGGHMCVSTSTSGLFMKHHGRTGDTPVPGCGYYADSSVGAAAATGDGEEIMKGALSYEVVRRMKAGMRAQEAASSAVRDLCEDLKRRNGYANAMSVIAIDADGNWGVGTNTPFPFVVASSEQNAVLYKSEVTEDGSVRIVVDEQ